MIRAARTSALLLTLSAALCGASSRALAVTVRAAPPAASAPAASAGLSASSVLQRVQLSLGTSRATPSLDKGSLALPPLALGPALRADALRHGLSAEGWEQLVNMAGRAQTAGLGRTLAGDAAPLPEDQALAALRSLDAALAQIAPEALEDPGTLSQLHRRSWDLLSPRADEADVPQASRRLASPRLIEEAGRLAALAREHTGQLESSLSAEAFRRELDRNKLVVEFPGLGKGEVTSIDGRLIARVAHAPSELSVLFLEQGQVAADSRHLAQFVARQFFDAGKDRRDGRRGRDTVLVWTKDGVPVAEELRLKPSFWTGDWWREYWRATYKTPGRSDVVFGLAMAGLQGALAWGLGAAKLVMTGAPVSAAPVVFTMGFGMLIGVYVSTYKNWTYRGPVWRQYLKSALISFAFAYPVVAFTQGLAALSPLTAGGLLLHAHIATNVALNNIGKVAWQQIPLMAERHRLITGNLVWEIKNAAVANQGFYMVNWTLRLAHLLQVPGGLVLFLAGIPAAMALSYRYAVKHGLPEAERMRRAPRALWDRLLGLLRRR